MGKLGDGLKKVLLAGVGGAAITAEKSKEIIDEMAKKGEETVERGKAMNQELKHNIKENVNVSVKTSTPEELDELLEKMTPEQLEQLKERIQILEEDVAEEPEVSEEPEEACGERNE